MELPIGGGNAMTPHISGTSLDAQSRYASGVKDILENFFNGSKQLPANLIVENGGRCPAFACMWLLELATDHTFDSLCHQGLRLSLKRRPGVCKNKTRGPHPTLYAYKRHMNS